MQQAIRGHGRDVSEEAWHTRGVRGAGTQDTRREAGDAGRLEGSLEGGERRPLTDVWRAKSPDSDASNDSLLELQPARPAALPSPYAAATHVDGASLGGGVGRDDDGGGVAGSLRLLGGGGSMAATRHFSAPPHAEARAAAAAEGRGGGGRALVEATLCVHGGTGRGTVRAGAEQEVGEVAAGDARLWGEAAAGAAGVDARVLERALKCPPAAASTTPTASAAATAAVIGSRTSSPSSASSTSPRASSATVSDLLSSFQVLRTPVSVLSVDEYVCGAEDGANLCALPRLPPHLRAATRRVHREKMHAKRRQYRACGANVGGATARQAAAVPQFDASESALRVSAAVPTSPPPSRLRTPVSPRQRRTETHACQRQLPAGVQAAEQRKRVGARQQQVMGTPDT